MKNALIFGLTGQDGAYLSKLLLTKGYNVFGTFRRTSHKCFERLDEMNTFDQITRIKADLFNLQYVNLNLMKSIISQLNHLWEHHFNNQF